MIDHPQKLVIEIPIQLEWLDDVGLDLFHSSDAEIIAEMIGDDNLNWWKEDAYFALVKDQTQGNIHVYNGMTDEVAAMEEGQ